MNEDDAIDSHPGWRWRTAEGAREDVLIRGMNKPLRDKILWLECEQRRQMQASAARFRESSNNEQGTAS